MWVFSMAKQIIVRGTPAEQELYGKLRSHYDRSENDLQTRRTDFDKKDELFRTFIDSANWPYRAQVADPSTFTFIVEKTSRLISNKLRGKVSPREGSDWIKAKVANELLDYQWDCADEGGSMIQKWALMDHNTRKYGAAFGICKWRYEIEPGTKEPLHDNPEFEVIPNRDVLVNPDHSSIRGWFQYRKYVTVSELKNVNDLARGKPVYKNLDLLQLSLKERATEAGDRRDTNYQSRNKAMKGLTDTLGEDRYDKYIEVVTEYTPTKILTFAPNHGVILREADNPWKEIPVIHLRYYVIDDDIYGLSEIEPIEKLQKVENALISQYLDTVNTDLYPPLLVRSTGVQMHTLEFGPNKKWLVTDPTTDIQRFQTSTAATAQFVQTITFIISRMQNAVGESGAGISNINPTEQDKTATEVKDQAVQRVARDNYNQIFLSEGLKKQMLFWLKMDSKFVTKNKLIRIMGNDSLGFFKQNMLVPPQTDPMTGQAALDPNTGMPQAPSPFGINELGMENEPVYPVDQGDETVPKFQMDETGESGELIIEPKDLAGTFDYVPDVESMSIQQDEDSKNKMAMIQLVISNPLVLQLLQQEGMKPKFHDLLVETFEDIGFKDAKRFFEQVTPQDQLGGMNGQEGIQAQLAGAGGPEAGLPPGGNVPDQGVPGGLQAVPPAEAQPVVPGS